jgi:hypothetical protein
MWYSAFQRNSSDLNSYLFGIHVQFGRLTAVNSDKNMMPVRVEYLWFPNKNGLADVLGTEAGFLTMHEHKFIP